MIFMGIVVGTMMTRMTGRLTALKAARRRRRLACMRMAAVSICRSLPAALPRFGTICSKAARAEMGLGPLALYGLKEACAKALEARRLRHEGIDPIVARRAARMKVQVDPRRH